MIENEKERVEMVPLRTKEIPDGSMNWTFGKFVTKCCGTGNEEVDPVSMSVSFPCLIFVKFILIFVK